MPPAARPSCRTTTRSGPSRAAGTLGVGKPITLAFDNGEGLEFRRMISVDENYLFTIEDNVVNRGGEPVTLYPYALISRHGKPEIARLLHPA